MNVVTYYHKVYDKKQYKPILDFLSNEPWEKAAELAFELTNAPDECLSEAKKRMRNSIFKRYVFKGPSLSVGDIVRVTNCDTFQTKFLRCEPSGWAFISIDLDEYVQK